MLATPIREVKASFEPLATRYTDKELDEAAGDRAEGVGPAALRHVAHSASCGSASRSSPTRACSPCSSRAAAATAGRFSSSRAARTTRSAATPGPFSFTYPANAPTQIVLAVEHYNRLARTLDKKVPVTIELNVQNTMTEDQTAFNVDRGAAGHRQGRRDRHARRALRLVARRHGRHRQRRGLGRDARSAAHPQGVRRDAAPHRAARRCGAAKSRACSGSKAYVKEHFADRETMQLKPAHGKVVGVLQRGQRHRRDPRRLPAGERGRRADLHRRGWSRSRTSA